MPNLTGPICRTHEPWYTDLATVMSQRDERTRGLLAEALAVADAVEAAGLSERALQDVDVVVGVGSWRAIYGMGAFSVLRILHQRKLLKLHRLRGSSGGAQAASVMSQVDTFSDSDMHTWFQAVPAFKALLQKHSILALVLGLPRVLLAIMDVLIGSEVRSYTAGRLFL